MTNPFPPAIHEPLFRISLAEWSLHRALESGNLNHLDLPKAARQTYGIDAIELVNVFFKDKAYDQKYLTDFKKRADDLDVKILLIMCDHEGMLGDADESQRIAAVENHRKWLEAARFLGCHSIRVNAHSTGSELEQQDRVADGLHRLSGFAAPLGLNVLVENHGGLSSNGSWLVSLIKKVNLPNCGTLPDFGNFKLADGLEYDRYQGVREMMPFARAVSAKSQDFDALGNETSTDYHRMLKIVLAAGYRGYLGIEYSGDGMDEPRGILATKWLLEKWRDEIAFGLPTKTLLS
ncbi:MAG: Xylose isomerase domain protein barrel [Pedosphaera sp.]|nr:Xylose isomerase domain protein barrel [Pedosphaera sp.]